MKDTLNTLVKFREDFRPFAASVSGEAADKYFEIADPIPFMTSVCRVTGEGHRALPATTPLDRMARVQIVDREPS